MKDHLIAKLHNDLRDTALKYRDAEQLRARLVKIVAPLVYQIKEEDIKRAKENLCAYDKRNPCYCEEEKSKVCYCDCCFHGTTWMAELILKLAGEE